MKKIFLIIALTLLISGCRITGIIIDFDEGSVEVSEVTDESEEE